MLWGSSSLVMHSTDAWPTQNPPTEVCLDFIHSYYKMIIDADDKIYYLHAENTEHQFTANPQPEGLLQDPSTMVNKIIPFHIIT